MAKYIISCLMLTVAVMASSFSAVRAESVAYIELCYGEKSFIYKDEYIEPTNHLVAEEIFERKINAPLGEKLEFIKNKLQGGADYKTALITCFPKLQKTVDDAIAALDRPPQDSEIRFDPRRKPMFTITRDKKGTTVLEEKLYMDIYFALRSSPSVRIGIPVERPEAKVTAADNIKLTNLRARYSTDFSSSTSERKHNIALALSKINGSVLSCGQSLSFNETVGRRTESNGFKEAKIIKGGKYVPGIGGGVCQASTTLYNAALLSGLTVESVYRHSLQSSYELPSFDAMVNSGSCDLKIRNDGDSPVFIRAYVGDSRAYVEIYGLQLPYTIKRKSEVIFTGETPGYDEFVDEKLEHFTGEEEPGTKKIISYSHPEVHSKGYLLYYDAAGRLLKSELIRSDKYNSVRGVIAVSPSLE